MNNRKVMFLVAAVGVLIGVAHGADKQATPKDGGQQGIVKEVRHELVMLPYYSVFDNLAFQVNGGVVTLEGQVTRPMLKSDAENVVKRIEGVDGVVNRIQVLPLSPMDDQIRRAAYRTLFSENSPIFRYGLGAVPAIHIIVDNGRVTLVGVVDSQADKDIAGVRVNGLSNVFSVTNDLTVQGK